MSNEELVSQYQITGRGFDELLSKNSGMIRRLFSSFNPDANDIEDFLQEGAIALERAARAFDFKQNNLFSTFAWRTILNRFIAMKKKKDRRISTVAILKKDFIGKTTEPGQTKDLSDAINLLPEYQRNSVMKVYFSGQYTRSDHVIAKRAMPALKKILSEPKTPFEMSAASRQILKKKN